MTLVADHVLFTTLPDWRSGLEAAERWRTEIAAAVTGARDHQALLPAPFRSLECPLQVEDPAERVALEAAVHAALKSGRAAVPYWPRPSAITGATGSAITLAALTWNWAAADYLFIFEDGVGEVAQIDNIASLTLNLEASLARTYTSAAEVFPMIFGRLEIEGSLLLPSVSEPRLSFIEPSGLGEKYDYTCPAEPTVPATGSFNLCDSPRISLANVCPADTLTWPAVLGATGYKVYKAASTAGPWSLIATLGSGTTSYEVTRTIAPAAGEYWAVTALFDSAESPRSNVTFFAAVHIEQVMRALQERCFAAVGAYLTFPDRVLPSPSSPGNFPANGFYDEDIVDDTAAADLVSKLCEQIHNLGADPEFISPWATTSDWSALDEIEFYDPATFPVPDISEVNSGNWETQFFVVREAVCLLTTLVVEGTFNGTATGGTADSSDWAEATSVALANWLADPGSAPSSFAGVLERNVENGSGTYTREFVSARGSIAYDLTAFPASKQTLSWWVRIDSTNDISADQVYDTQQFDPGFYAAHAPLDSTGEPVAPDGFYVRTNQTPAAAANWSTPDYGPDEMIPVYPYAPGSGQQFNVEWLMHDAVVQVYKSPAASAAHWTYYP